MSKNYAKIKLPTCLIKHWERKMGKSIYYAKRLGHGFYVFISIIARGLAKGIRNAWRNYQIDRERRERERAHYAQIEREGRAYGHGVELGSLQAKQEYYDAKREQRHSERVFRNLFVSTRVEDNKLMFGDTFKKKKRRRF